MPDPSTIKQARQSAGLTQSQSAELVEVTLRTWQRWESGDQEMHEAFWQWFRRKVRRRQKKP